jgi:hypothetical protein
MIAAFTGCHDVVPIMAAAAVARKDVIQCQVARLLATVLAGEAVSQEDIAARETALRPRAANEVNQADDGRNFENGGGTMEITAAVLDDLGFAAIDQYESAPDVADVQRLVVLIQY